ncbi:MAG: hypothetical protein CMQ40_11640 [Gammaproteobacteria bacterium]|nr:hypothetical protein [Gammaproteobacteria bacterium]|tara:strand:+ start:122 stop:1045 length:924 start_codon:yes stop_codon:yes gene_type:complete
MYAVIFASFFTLELLAEPAKDLENWFQIDLVILKHTNSDDSNERWITENIVYPSDVIAISEEIKYVGGEETLESGDHSVESDPSSADQFIPFEFEGLSDRKINKELIESLKDKPFPETTDFGRTPNVQTLGISANTEEIYLSIKDLVMALDTESIGQQAYKDNSANSSLSKIANRLGRSSKFEILANRSWIQPLSPIKTPILIMEGAKHENRFEVEGTLALSKNRFLHAETNLWFNKFREVRENLDGFLNQSTNDLEEIRSPDSSLFLVTRTYSMNQNRRIRKNELHYIDHPVFGLIIRISQHNIQS